MGSALIGNPAVFGDDKLRSFPDSGMDANFQELLNKTLFLQAKMGGLGKGSKTFVAGDAGAFSIPTGSVFAPTVVIFNRVAGEVGMAVEGVIVSPQNLPQTVSVAGPGVEAVTVEITALNTGAILGTITANTLTGGNEAILDVVSF